MEGTTIFLSREFHDWIKGKGRKGESYENIIMSLVKPELLQELRHIRRRKPKPSAEAMEKNKPKASNGPRKNNKPKAPNAKAYHSSNQKVKKKPKKPNPSKKKTPSAGHKAAKPNAAKPLLQNLNQSKELKYKKSLELQSLKVELELAKLSNDINKIRSVSAQIARLENS